MLNGDQLHAQRQHLLGPRILPARVDRQARLHQRRGRARTRSAAIASSTSRTCWSRRRCQLAVADGLDLTQFDSRARERHRRAERALCRPDAVQRRALAAQLPHRSAVRRHQDRPLSAHQPRPHGGRPEHRHLLPRERPSAVPLPRHVRLRPARRRQHPECRHRHVLPDGRRQSPRLRPQPVAGVRLSARPGRLVRQRDRPEHGRRVRGEARRLQHGDEISDEQAERVLHHREPVEDGPRSRLAVERSCRLPLRHSRVERAAGGIGGEALPVRAAAGRRAARSGNERQPGRRRRPLRRRSAASRCRRSRRPIRASGTAATPGWFSPTLVPRARRSRLAPASPRPCRRRS